MSRILVALACGATLMLLAAPAVARVIPNACIAGVGLWDSKERVAREWGLPSRRTPSGPDVIWHYPNRRVLLYRWRRPPAPTRWIVLVVTTTDPRDRLDAGIGVGSWRSEVRAVAEDGCPPRAEFCDVASSTGQSRATSVRFRDNRVTE